MAQEIIDLTDEESPPAKSRTHAKSTEYIDLTDNDDDYKVVPSASSISGPIGSFDDFLQWLRDHAVTAGIGNRQLERLRELWDDGVLDQLSDHDGLSDVVIQETFSPQISVVKAREILKSLRQIKRTANERSRRQVSARSKGRGDRVSTPAVSKGQTYNAMSDLDHVLQSDKLSPTMLLRSHESARSKTGRKASGIRNTTEQHSESYQDDLGPAGNVERGRAVDTSNGSLANGTPPKVKDTSGVKSRATSARNSAHKATITKPDNERNQGRHSPDSLGLDASASSPQTPSLKMGKDSNNSPDTESSQTRDRDRQGRFVTGVGSARQVPSPTPTKRSSKRANETELLRESLTHGNFRPAALNDSQLEGPGLRSSTRPHSSSRQLSDTVLPGELMNATVNHQDEKTEVSRDLPNIEGVQHGSEPPMLEDDTYGQSREGGTEEPIDVLCTLEAVEQVLLDHAKELAQDHEYYTKHYLAAARMVFESLSPELISNCRVDHNERSERKGSSARVDATSPFADMEAIDTPLIRAAGGNDSKQVMAQIVHPVSKGPKGQGPIKSTLSVPVTAFHTDQLDVPFYTHYVSAGSNFRAENCDKLLYTPYFHEAQEERPDLKGLETHLNQEYKNLADKRPTHVQLLHKSMKWRPYVESFFEDIGCGTSDVLRYLLQPDSDLRSDLGLDHSNLQLWKDRRLPRKEDFDTEHPKWKEVFKNLPPSKEKALAFAGLASHAFFRVARFNIWHIVRRSATVEEARHAVQPVTNTDALAEIQSALCRICHRLNCPYHGLNDEDEQDTSSDDEDDDATALGTMRSKTSDHTEEESSTFHGYYSSDEDGINDERPVLPPQHGRNRSPRGSPLVYSRRPFDIGRWLDKGVTNMMHMRKPFWPCDHEGSCESKKCRCWRQGINCEKACGCSRVCKRRFPGCTCSQKGKPCYSEGKCACRALNRECDADLCGSCGARDVLDPINRYHDEILAGRCHNASIQRDRPRNTKVGVSQVVGCGLYACEDIPQGGFISEYKGEVCGHQEGERRGVTNGYRPNNYLFTVSADIYDVDSMHYGNKTRFINNSQNPRNINVEAKLKLCNMVVRIGMFAIRDIKAGEELFFNYGYEKQISDTFWEPGEAPKEKTLGRIEAASSKRKSKAKAQLSARVAPASSESSPHEGRLHKYGRKARARKLNEIPQDDENDVDYRPSSQLPAQASSRQRGAAFRSDSDGNDDDGDDDAQTPNGKHRLPRSAQNTPRGKFNTKESWAPIFVDDSDGENESDDYQGSDKVVDEPTSEADRANGPSEDDMEVTRGRKRKRMSAH